MSTPTKPTRPDPLRVAHATYLYLNQGTRWIPKDGRPILVADMDPAWRHNAAAWMLRRARRYLAYYGYGEIQAIWGAAAPEVLAENDGEPVYGRMVSLAPTEGSMAADALERELEEAERGRQADPQGWLKTTPLYRALVDGLPEVTTS